MLQIQEGIFYLSPFRGGSVSLLFSLNYPQRTLGVLVFGIFAKRRYSKDYLGRLQMKEREFSYRLIEDNLAHAILVGLGTLVRFPRPRIVDF